MHEAQWLGLWGTVDHDYIGYFCFRVLTGDVIQL